MIIQRVTNNNNLFKSSEPNTKSLNTNFEKHRVWFNLSSGNGGFSQVLLDYADGATNGWDKGLDAVNYGGNSVAFYFVTLTIEMKTQAKPLPCSDTDCSIRLQSCKSRAITHWYWSFWWFI